MKERIKIICAVLVMALALPIAACTKTEQETTVVTAVTESSGGMGNPWKSADTLDQAAEGAGLGRFDLADGLSVGDVPVRIDRIRYTDGLVEIECSFADVSMVIRKGLVEAGINRDVSGDYNSYAAEWTQNVKGLEVDCYGFEEGKAVKLLWSVDDYSFAILVEAEGGADYGLSADEISSLINAIQ